MRYILCAMALGMLAMVACNNNKEAGQQQATVVVADTMQGTWYKHYTGTIAGKPVTADLYYYKRSVTGSYYYNDKNIIINLHSTQDTTPADISFYLDEEVPTERQGEEEGAAHWLVTLKGDELTGKWKGAEGVATYDIKLKETYIGACKLDLLIADSTRRVSGTEMSLSYILSIPAGDIGKEERALVDTVLMKQVRCAPGDRGSYSTCIYADMNMLFTQQQDSTVTQDDNGEDYTIERDEVATVVYNDHGLLVFSQYWYDYEGGAHGMYGNGYTCIDMQDKKIWKLKEIMTTDTARIEGLLAQEARRTFKVKAGELLSESMLVDTIPVTDNFYFTTTGIVFNYAPYEVASFADGDVAFFIPYTKIMDLLTPDFKKRMKL